jgi:hypothetical protein
MYIRYHIQDVLDAEHPYLMRTTWRNPRGLVMSLNNVVGVLLEYMESYPDEYFVVDDFFGDEYSVFKEYLIHLDLLEDWVAIYNPLSLGNSLYRPLCRVLDVIENIIGYEDSEGSFCFADLGVLGEISMLFGSITLTEQHNATQAQQYSSESLYNVAIGMPLSAVDALVANYATRTTKATDSLYNDAPYVDDIRISDHWNTKYGKAITTTRVPRNTWCKGIATGDVDADTGETIWEITDIFGQTVLSRSNEDKALVCKKLLQVYTDKGSSNHKFLHRKYQELMEIRK